MAMPMRQSKHTGPAKSPADFRHAGLKDKQPEEAYIFCACMKSSKPASAKRNHRFWSRRKLAKSS